jgi:hypothetical protein
MVVAAIGTGLLITLARRANREVALIGRAAEGLDATVTDLRAARHRFVVDVAQYRVAGQEVLGRPVQGSAPR